jgi:basic membrane lipoprotein Med (substrate-binding protein (PBP1-ABC) superfamily)
MLYSGAVLIFGVGRRTGSNAIEAAAIRGAYGIGADGDQFRLLPVVSPRILTSYLKMNTPALCDLLISTRYSQPRSSMTSGIIPGPEGIAPYHDLTLELPDEG